MVLNKAMATTIKKFPELQYVLNKPFVADVLKTFYQAVKDEVMSRSDDQAIINKATEMVHQRYPELKDAPDCDGFYFDVGEHEQDGITDCYFGLLNQLVLEVWLNENNE